MLGSRDQRGVTRQMPGLVAMISGTVIVTLFGILSRFLIDDLDLSRAQVGGLVSAFAIVGAFASTPVGRLVDHIGGRSGVSWLFILSAFGMVGITVAFSYGLLLAAAALSGLAQALANPATNKMIARYREAGSRGLTVGIKESGVQVGIFLGGLLIPAGAPVAPQPDGIVGARCYPHRWRRYLQEASLCFRACQPPQDRRAGARRGLDRYGSRCCPAVRSLGHSWTSMTSRPSTSSDPIPSLVRLEQRAHRRLRRMGDTSSLRTLQ